MNKCEKAVENHKKGYNCAQAVACVFADELGCGEDELFRLTEAFGGGMGGTQGICGAVSAMVLAAGKMKSFGTEKLPETNKKASYQAARGLMESFAQKVGSALCSEIKGNRLCTCDGCIEQAVKILEEFIEKTKADVKP
ncbi:MAG: C_GCAxxG_C_C family protein [Ruminococcaceae bacterium]|nr:C_GCAxxG_C_C family protein [Oscillospiraceae bacterium]